MTIKTPQWQGLFACLLIMHCPCSSLAQRPGARAEIPETVQDAAVPMIALPTQDEGKPHVLSPLAKSIQVGGVTFDPIDLSLLRLAVGAIFGVNFLMPQTYRRTGKRDLLAVRVEAHRPHEVPFVAPAQRALHQGNAAVPLVEPAHRLPDSRHDFFGDLA